MTIQPPAEFFLFALRTFNPLMGKPLQEVHEILMKTMIDAAEGNGREEGEEI